MTKSGSCKSPYCLVHLTLSSGPLLPEMGWNGTGESATHHHSRCTTAYIIVVCPVGLSGVSPYLPDHIPLKPIQTSSPPPADLQITTSLSSSSLSPTSDSTFVLTSTARCMQSSMLGTELVIPLHGPSRHAEHAVGGWVITSVCAISWVPRSRKEGNTVPLV